MDTRQTDFNKLLATEYSADFDKLRREQMITGHFKYGSIRMNAKRKYVDYIATLEKRLQAYKETGNTEFLADIANFAMIEFMYPQHSNAHYEPTDSDKSPGLVGLSVQEMLDYGEKGRK